MKSKYFIIVLVSYLIFAPFKSFCFDTSGLKQTIKAEEVLPNYQAYQSLLNKYVNAEGKVNYKSFKQAHQQLKNVLNSFASIKLNNLSKKAQLAFWINIYNAATIDQILSNYPVKSIKDIANGKVWDLKLPYQFNQEALSLNDIEHKKLLKTFTDARIHFAINCASVSCPPLNKKAYTEENVEELLQLNTSKFLNNPNYNKIGVKIFLSSIFKWYNDDFKAYKGSVLAFINPYLYSKKITEKDAIDFLDYNWNLNEQ